MKRVDYMNVAHRAITQIKEGAFLTVQSGKALNTMTIGWASLGHVWRKPIMMVAVRSSRHTFSIIETAKDYTVSIPSVDMKREVTFCGTKSGRRYDKFKECDLQLLPGQKVVTPIIKAPGLHLECTIIYKSTMDPEQLDEEYDAVLYPESDYHTLYFGEIVACYELESPCA